MLLSLPGGSDPPRPQDSVELIGGFAVLELADVDEAIELCRGYAKILGGTLEIDVRLVDVSDPDQQQ